MKLFVSYATKKDGQPGFGSLVFHDEKFEDESDFERITDKIGQGTREVVILNIIKLPIE